MKTITINPPLNEKQKEFIGLVHEHNDGNEGIGYLQAKPGETVYIDYVSNDEFVFTAVEFEQIKIELINILFIREPWES